MMHLLCFEGLLCLGTPVKSFIVGMLMVVGTQLNKVFYFGEKSIITFWRLEHDEN